MENEKDWLYGYGLNIFSFFRILKIKRAIKNGEKTARNYCILADWYSMFDIFNIKSLLKKELYYALKAIRTDKNYPPAYMLAGNSYSALNIKSELSEKFLNKAIELGGDSYYSPRFVLFGQYLQTQQFAKAYQIGTEFLNCKFKIQEYWAMALSVISSYYGFCIEYRNAFKKFFSICIKNKEFPKTSSLIYIILSLFLIYCSIQSQKNKYSGSLILDSLIGNEDYQFQLLLANKLILREKRDKHKNNDKLASLYIQKSNALMYKENPEYDKAMKVLEQYKKCKKSNDLCTYYYFRANYAYIARDIDNAFIWVNEALLHRIDANTLMLKGFICNELENYEESISSFLKALEYEDCEKESIYQYLCDGYYILGNFQKALHYINLALMINKNARSYYAKADCLEALGRIKESQECFDKYNEIIKEKSN